MYFKLKMLENEKSTDQQLIMEQEDMIILKLLKLTFDIN